jgi:hypothetical protein
MTNSKDYAKIKGISIDNYDPIIVNFCYSYSRKTRECFFDSKICSFLFILSVPYILKREGHMIEKNYIVKDFIQSATANLENGCLRLL